MCRECKNRSDLHTHLPVMAETGVIKLPGVQCNVMDILLKLLVSII